ncbi:C25 family cysteine peptidase [Arenicella sp.]|nr:C25 family cysteine peptidase [Arenicella sp.]
MTVEKSSTTTEITTPGPVTYDYLVTNTGNTSLNALALVDDNADAAPVCAATVLTVAPDAGSSTTCTATYTVTQADIDNNGSPTAGSGSVFNNVTASTTEADDAVDDLSIPITADPNFTASKTQTSAKSPVDTAGDVITYDVVLVNDGMVSLTGVVVNDTLPDGTIITLSGQVETGGTGISDDGIFDVGETWTFATEYTVTQADVDAGLDLVNTISVVTDETTADGDAPLVESEVTPVDGDPNFTASKTQTSAKSPVDSAGDVITYDVVLFNDGMVSLNDPVVTDVQPDGAVIILTGEVETGGTGDNTNGILDVGETWTYMTSYLVTQSDIDAGLDLINVISVETNETIADGDDPVADNALTPVDGDPNFTAVKTQTSAKSPVDSAGDVITYDVVLFNDGMVSLSNPVVTDIQPDGAVIILTSEVETGGTGDNTNGILDVGETWTYMTSYTVTQEDVNDGLDLTNAISVETDETTADGDLPLTDTAVTPVDGDPNFTISKTQTSLKSPVDTAGDIISYDVVLFNDGMVDLNSPEVTDTLPDGSVTILSGEVETGGSGINNDGILDVGETWTYTTSYTVTPDDLDLGVDLINLVSAVTNETIADGDDPLTAMATTPTQQLPSLSVDKTQSSGPNPATTIGDVLDYTITIVNTGNVTLTGVVPTDTLPDGSVGSLSAVVETLTSDNIFESGETWTYTISYTVTAADLSNGDDLVNSVSVVTTEVPGPTIDTATTPVFVPSLLVAKSIAGVPIELGDGVYQVTYNFVIENNGNVDMTNLQLEDDLNAMINTPNINGATVANPLVTYLSGTVVTPNPGYTGTGVNTLLTGTDNYPVDATTELSLSFEFTPDRYFGPFNNIAEVSGVDPMGAIETDSSENAVAPSAALPGEDIASPTPFELDIVPTTPITLGWINITDNLNGSATIEWQTATEVANAGFNILVLNNSGDWVQANESMISSQGDSTSAQNYRYLSAIVGEKFMLVDISVTGVEVKHGPFDLNQSSGIFVTPKVIQWDQIQQESDAKQLQREEQRRQELQDRLSRPQSSNGASKFMQSLAASLLSIIIPTANAVDLVSFEVESAGLYQVTHQDLLTAGLDLTGIELSRLGLQEAGILWPMDKRQSGDMFTSSTRLLFPARGLDSLYSGVNKYTLVLDEGSLDIARDATDIPGNNIALAYSYLAEARYAPQNFYSQLSPESDDSWYADALNSINEPALKSVSLTVDGYVAPLSFGGGFGAQIKRQATQNPLLEVNLWGGSALPGNGVTDPDHQVLVELNGQSVADIQFDGLTLETTHAPLASVIEGTNVVDISVPNSQGYAYDLIRLDHVSLRYPRSFEAQANALVFESDWDKFRVSNLSSNNARVVRLDENNHAFYMTERGDGDCTSGCVYFGGDASANNRYFVATNAGLKTPEITPAVDGSNLLTTPANFIIIAHPDFIDTSSQALEGYAAEISGQYGSVDLVDVETIYAAYSGGVVDAYAIKDFISDAYADRGTRHILLVGGDNYDYQDFTNSGAKSFIPSIYQPISNNVKAVPSDSSYVLVDDDLAPDLTITRLPVRTTADLDNLIAKRHNYLARRYQDKVLMAADEVDNSNYSFKADSLGLIADHFQSNDVDEVYLDDTTVEAARAQLIDAFNGGVSFASYFGHSSTDRWSISSILSGDDVASLDNAQSPAVVAQWGCWNTFYASPEHDSMAHRFLLEGPQGAVTVMGASSFTEADAEKRMAEYLSANLQQGMSIGDAVLDAKQKIFAETPYQLDVLLGWAVLGFDDMTVFE